MLRQPAARPGAFYLRLVGKPLEVYQYLEPLYNDYRKLRLRNADGSFALAHMDEIVDELLRNDYLFDIALPRIPSRCRAARLHGQGSRACCCCCCYLSASVTPTPEQRACGVRGGAG